MDARHAFEPEAEARPAGAQVSRFGPVLLAPGRTAAAPTLPGETGVGIPPVEHKRGWSIRRPPNKALALLLGVILVAVLIPTVPLAIDELQWRAATSQNTEIAYSEYLRAWPNGRHANEARQMYDARDWQIAGTARSIDSYEAYILTHPDGSYVPQARQAIEELRWQAATTANTAAAFAAYLGDYPGGRYATAAQAAVDQLDWQAAAGPATLITL